ncbi:MAG: HlyD family type I secretion periplasmic adaptor subunit [Planctomycetota bacterium]|jgi:hemolysin D|nr:HlyD family type I secretion periplasmic adaptor subunit [Blastopirellula sp.]
MASASGPTLKERVQQQRDARRRAVVDELRARSGRTEQLLNEFQPDAVEIEQARIPGGMRWTLYTVIAMIVATIGWSCWAEVDKIVTSQGKLTTADKQVIIQTPNTAPIRTVLARFGDIVRAGDVLATLDPTFSAADLAQLEQKLISLDAQIARLNAERDSIPYDLTGHENHRDWLMQQMAYVERKNEYDSKLAEFESEFSKVETQLKNNGVEQAIEKEKLVKLEEALEARSKLKQQGSVSDIDVMRWEIQTMDSRKNIDVLEGKEKELAAEKEAITKRRAAYIASWRADVAKQLVEAAEKKNSSDEEVKKAKRTSELVELRVPTDLPYKEFYVQEVADRTVGSVVQPGEALFKLTPLDAELEVEVEIPGKDISYVKTGDLVRVKLSAFPYQKNGWLDGNIRTISEGSFEKEVQNGAPPITTFRARVTLKPEQINFRAKDYRLLPGMTADADIKVGKRRVIEYILYPLMGAVDSSIREP